MDREAWLEKRRQGIGGSDIAAVCGLSDYSTPFEVYLDKVGILPPKVETEAMRWGHLLEPVIALEFARRHGCELHLSDDPLVVHPQYPWCRATPDRFVVGTPRLLEIKTSRSSEGWGEEGTDEIPMGYLLQCQWQMLACAAQQIEAVDVAALLQGNELRTYVVHRDGEVQDYLLRIAGEFWEKVQSRTPPPLDYTHPEAGKLAALAYRPKKGTSMDLFDPVDLCVVDNYVALGEEINRLDKLREADRARLIVALGECETAHLPDGRRVRKTIVPVMESVRAAYEQTRLTIQKAKV